MELSAETLFNRIGDRAHAVKRPKNPNTDRKLRNMVEKAQLGGRLIVNVGDGEGYYEADLNNPEEAMAYRRYINKEKSRIRKHAAKIRAMEATADNYYQMDFYDDLEVLE